MPKTIRLLLSFLLVLIIPVICFSQASFTAPDTVCINNPVNITNTSIGATSYFWNFCVADIDKTPVATNIGNPGGALQSPVFMDYAFVNGNYYGFTTNFAPGGLVRLDFGNSLLNTPTAVNLGNFGGIIPPNNSAEGLQVVENEGKWYVIMVGGNPLVPGGVTPRILKVELGANIANPTPVATDWGNLGNMLQSIDLNLFKDGVNWYGFTVNSENNTITRFNFTNSFNNTPTAVNLGNIGSLSYPTGIYVINDNGNYRVFVTNGGDNSRNTHPNWSLSRLDFGNTLLNAPTGVNLGNPGGVLRHARDLTIMRSCDQIVAFAVNGAFGSNDIVKLNFNSNLSSIPTGTSLGNIGNLNFPHSISKLFRVNEDIYGFVTNVANNTITRFRFQGCANASIASSTLQTPPPITYNTPGTYNINLTIDDGLPTQSVFCKQVVVMAAPVQAPTQQISLCSGNISVRIGTGTKNARYTWSTGVTNTDSIDVTAGGKYWVQVDRFGCTVTDTIVVTASSCVVGASFTAPDTVCINNPVTITNTSAGASSYFWNFCVADITTTPQGTNLGNISNVLSMPVFMDYVYVNGNYYGFLVNHAPGGLVRLDFGNSLLNNPTAVNLGNFGGNIPVQWGAEGIRVVQNNGKWYAIVVGGAVAAGYTPRILKFDFGTNITNPTPVCTNWGNLGNMAQPVDFDLFQENGNWYGFTINADNNTFTRFNFTNSFDNTPTAVNLGNIGGLSYPTGVYTVNDNGFYRVFITNETPNPSITRLDFGSSLLNTPVGVNLGNPGNRLTSPRDLTIMRSCGQIVAFVVNGRPGFGEIVRYDFNNDFSSIPTATSLGNIGNLNFAHSVSRLFRVSEDIFGFVTNVSNNTITRFRFPGCTNASVVSSTLQTPPPVTYNTPGTYNINLTVDDGLPTQSAFCKQVVVMAAPVAAPTRIVTICDGEQIKIGIGTKSATYLWNTGATTDSIDVTNPGTYWVEINSFGCKTTDTFKITPRPISDFSFKQDVCNPYSLQFFNASSASIDPWWDMGDGTIVSGNPTLTHAYGAFGTYQVRFSVSDGTCRDTIIKFLPVNVLKEDIVLTNDTVICDGTTKQLRAVQALSYCWFPTTYLDNPAAQNPVTSTPQNITYYLHSESTGNNLIVNGDFSAGNTGFTSQYVYAATNNTEGEYFVGPNPQLWNASTSNCPDHTGNGNMMLVNGNPIADQTVWTQTINVFPNTNYAFSTWIQSIYNVNPAQLQFSINGNDLEGPITASLPSCNWQQFYTTWNSGNSTTARISIVNKNTIIMGNDFALDDISFAPVFIKRDSVVIKVDKPIVRTNNDTTVCSDKQVPLVAAGAATYSWSPVAGLSNPAIANPVAIPAATPTQYIVTGITNNGCVAKDTVLVGAYPKPVITKTQDTLVCRNTAFPLFISGGVSYAWSSSGQLSGANSDRPIVSVGASPATYQVAITDSYSCVSLDSVEVTVRPYPVFRATGNQAICTGSSKMMQASGGDVYEWSPAQWFNEPASPSPVVTPETTTLFSVYIQENTCGFDTTINMLLTVNPVPALTVNKANDVNCNTPTAQLNVTGAMRYTWSPAAGLDNATKANPVAAIDTTTEYRVTGVNQFGCSSNAYIQVKATKDGIPRFVVPNSFTPNGDRKNDCFGIQRWGNAIVQEFTVYNRWGQKVFQANNPNQCWDGTFNGKPQDSGGYVYVIRARTLCGEITTRGIVMLIR